MHFVVYVIGDEDLEAALEPFQENNMGTVDEKYLTFIDRTDEVKEEWKDFPLTALADHSSAKDYKNIEEFAKDWFGYEVTVDGHYGYTDNPNAKWDWWELGGRWDGHLHLCTGTNSSQAPIEMVDIDKLGSAAAILYRGEWIACDDRPFSMNEEDEVKWLNKIKALMSDIPPGNIVSVVDCHI